MTDGVEMGIGREGLKAACYGTGNANGLGWWIPLQNVIRSSIKFFNRSTAKPAAPPDDPPLQHQKATVIGTEVYPINTTVQITTLKK